MKKFLFTLIFVFPLSVVCLAQSFMGWEYNDRFFSAYIGTGRAGYFGELTNGKPLAGGLSMVNLGVEARLLSRVAARVQVSRYRLEGSDTNAADSSAHQQRNLSFSSNNLEFMLQGMYFFKRYNGMYHKRRNYEPYVAVGIGYTTFNPTADLDGETYTLSEYKTENKEYGKSTLVVPMNIGVKAKLNEFMNLNFDLGYRITFTDYLDDVSSLYGGPFADGSLQSRLSNRKDEIPVVNEEAYEQYVPGMLRGDPNNNDKYFFINFSLEIYLPRDIFKSRGGKTRKEKIIGKPSAY